MRTAFVHDAVLDPAPADHRAPGGAVTMALCGSLVHEPPCPVAAHHTTVEVEGLAAAGAGPVRGRTDRGSRGARAGRRGAGWGRATYPDGVVSTWTVVSSGPDEVRVTELTTRTDSSPPEEQTLGSRHEATATGWLRRRVVGGHRRLHGCSRRCRPGSGRPPRTWPGGTCMRARRTPPISRPCSPGHPRRRPRSRPGRMSRRSPRPTPSRAWWLGGCDARRADQRDP